MTDLSRDRLLEAFSYDRKEACIYWKFSTGRVRSGQRAGCIKGDGYWYVQLDGIRVPIHRAIWIIENGEIPNGYNIDHIDRDKSNNHISNLRLATHAENMRNNGARKNSKSSVNGVHFCTTVNKWVARITKDRKMINLGSFKDLDEAIWTRQKAEFEMFGEFSALKSARAGEKKMSAEEIFKVPERIVAWAYYGDLENGRWSKADTGGVPFVRADLSPSPEVVKELVEALRITRDRLLRHLHNELDGVWSEQDFLDEVKEADDALAKLEGGE